MNVTIQLNVYIIAKQFTSLYCISVELCQFNFTIYAIHFINAKRVLLTTENVYLSSNCPFE